MCVCVCVCVCVHGTTSRYSAALTAFGGSDLTTATTNPGDADDDASEEEQACKVEQALTLSNRAAARAKSGAWIGALAVCCMNLASICVEHIHTTYE